MWYKINQQPPTNPERRHLTFARKVDDKIRDVIINQMLFRPELGVTMWESEVPLEWTIPTMWNNALIFMNLDAIYKDGDQMVGVLIFCGSGYGFQSEVFGTKNKEGQIKQDHLILAYASLLFCPKKLNRIDILYVDRGSLNEMKCFSVFTSPIEKKDLIQAIVDSTGTTMPQCSYTKTWTSKEAVAKLYAEKKISKARYEAWIDTHIGGDWHCEYCPFLDRCTQDDGRHQ